MIKDPLSARLKASVLLSVLSVTCFLPELVLLELQRRA
jgi:hypothetical protein